METQQLPIPDPVADLEVAFALTAPLAAGQLLRVAADGVRAMTAFWCDLILPDPAGDETLPEVHRFRRAEMQQRHSWYVRHRPLVTVRVVRPLAAGTRLVARGQATTGLTEQYLEAAEGEEPIQWRGGNPYAGLTWGYCLRAADELEGEWRQVSDWRGVELVAGPPARLEAYLRPGGRLALQHYDRFTNPVRSDAGAFSLVPDGADGDDGEQATAGAPIRPAPGAAATVVELSGADATLRRVAVRDDRGRRAVSSPRPAGLDDRPVFFGEFHWHAAFSGDGQRPLADAMRSARDELGLDFAGPADHLGGGRYTHGTPAEQRAICAQFDAPGRFVSLPGFELSGREGHANLYADSWELLLELAERTGQTALQGRRYPLEDLAALCPPGRAILVPHHVNMTSYDREGVVRPEDGRPYWNRFDWGPRPERAVTRLVEIHQGRGSFEAEEPDAGWRIDVGGYGSSVRTALARGFRVGFTGGTDNHCGWPTRRGEGWNGLTGVLADELTLPALFRALHQRRCYATTGVRIVADVRLNGEPMGSELALPPGAPRRFAIRLHGTAPLERVEIISCGAVLASLPVAGGAPDLEAEWTDERPGRPLRDCYYYLRARQADGHCAWTSPHWVDLPATEEPR